MKGKWEKWEEVFDCFCGDIVRVSFDFLTSVSKKHYSKCREKYRYTNQDLHMEIVHLKTALSIRGGQLRTLRRWIKKHGNKRLNKLLKAD